MTLAEPELRDALLREFYSHWNVKRGTRPFPNREDVKPTDLPELLPYMIVSDVERDLGLRFRIRAAGAHFEATIGQNLAGTYVGECGTMPIEVSESLLGQYRQCAECGRPVLQRQTFPFQGVNHAYERLLLPLARDRADRVDLIISAIAFANPRPAPPPRFGQR
jgi:hypothetical protein